ncbi:hypothetical protein WR25_13577 [Diploscapter pachys]|uniref:Uncharacterized protein n=1 Tax=Diploscapter pachys TaxID=2018661 RepID=A0A2A2KD26_9BILA|nr:hypothetical protein WR25_13577 [Diploscapter pachys]
MPLCHKAVGLAADRSFVMQSSSAWGGRQADEGVLGDGGGLGTGIQIGQEAADGGGIGGGLVALADQQVGVADDRVARSRYHATGVEDRHPLAWVGAVGGGARGDSGTQGGAGVGGGWQRRGAGGHGVLADAGDHGVVAGGDIVRADVADGAIGGVDRVDHVGAAGDGLPGGRFAAHVGGGEGAADHEGRWAGVSQEARQQLGGAAAAGTVDDLDRRGIGGAQQLAPGGGGAGEHAAQLSAGQLQVGHARLLVGDGNGGAHRWDLHQLAPGGGLAAVVGRQFRSAQHRVAAGEVDVGAGWLVDRGRCVGQERRLAATAADTGVAEVGRQQARQARAGTGGTGGDGPEDGGSGTREFGQGEKKQCGSAGHFTVAGWS